MGKSAVVPKTNAEIEINGATSNGFIKYEPREFLFEYAKNTAVYSKVVKKRLRYLWHRRRFLLSIHRDSAKWSFFFTLFQSDLDPPHQNQTYLLH